MNHAARPLAFSYVRSQGPRGITIRTGRESPAQPSPGLSGRQSPSAGKAKRPHNAALGSRSCPREDPVAHNYNGHGADSFEPSSLHTATLLRIPRGPAPPRVRPRPCVWATTANEVLANSAAFVRDLWPSTGVAPNGCW